MSTLGLVSRFALAAAVGSTVVLGVGAAAAPPPSSLLLPVSTDFELTADTGDVVARFSVEDDPVAALPGATSGAGGPSAPSGPVLLSPLPDDLALTLVAYKDAAAPDAGAPNARPAWLAPTGYPRVTPITQFDGGPLGGSNCTMASGAMLARLGFGIVTTGTQLRALQPDQVGGTSLVELEIAVGKFGVRFNRAALTPLQLRSVIYAGAGAVIQGTYGLIPFDLRLQKDFLAGHAIYIDGFRPASAVGPAAYYVIDPLGRPGAGYRGAWWPADLVEAFATDFGGGYVFTSWAYPGGKTPTTYPKLPPDAFPSGNGPGGPGGPNASASADPSASVAPSLDPSASPSSPPLPEGDPGFSPPPVGDDVPATPSYPPWGGKVHLDPGLIAVLLNSCAAASPPAWCPGGIVAVLPADPVLSPLPTLRPDLVVSKIDLLFADQVGPETMRVIFAVPEGALPSLQFWNANGGSSGIGYASSIEPAVLDGRLVQVAEFTMDPGGTYQFVASAAGKGIRAVSAIGALGP